MKCIKRSHLPVDPHLASLIAWWLFLEHVHAAPWIYGVLYALCGIRVILWIVCLFVQEQATPKYDDAGELHSRVMEIVAKMRSTRP